MRAKRLFARRRVPSSKLKAQLPMRQTSDHQQSGRDQTLSAPRSLPLPTALSPRHPDSFRYANGLYKYATGLVIPSPSIQSSFNVTTAAFKVYSTATLSSLACTMLRNLLKEDNQPQGTDLRCTLRHLFNITAKAHSTVESAAGVFLQVYREASNLRTLRLPWVSLPAGSRQWNLYCETYRISPESGISLPRICLAILNIPMQQAVRRGPWSRSGTRITLQVFADLRPSMLHGDPIDDGSNDSGTGKNAGGVIQSIVDDVLCAIARVTQASDIISHVEFMRRLKTAVSSYLRTSGLHSLMNFRNLEIVLRDPNRQRYVSNAILNPDGGELDALREDTTEQRAAVQLASGSQIDKYSLSEPTVERTGLKSMKCKIEPRAEGPIDPRLIGASELTQEFERVCQNSDKTGSKCCIEAARYLSQKYYGVEGHMLFEGNTNLRPSAGKILNVVLHINDGRGDLPLSIRLHSVRMKFRLSDSEYIDIQIADIRLWYDLSQHPHQYAEGWTEKNQKVPDEISILPSLFESICQKVSEKLEFQSLQEIPSKLAEAVLELLDIPSLGITLERVELGVRPMGNPQAQYEAQATRKSESQPTLNVSGALPQPFNSALMSEDGDTANSHISSYDGSNQSTTSPPWMLPPEMRYKKRGSEHIISTTIQSNRIKSKTGFETFRIEMSWFNLDDIEHSHFTVTRLSDLVEDSLSSDRDNTIASLQSVLSKLVDLNTKIRNVSIYTRTDVVSRDMPLSSDMTGLSVLSAKTRTRHEADGFSDVLRIALPPLMFSVQLKNGELVRAQTAQLAYILEGGFPQNEPLSPVTMFQQVLQLLQDVHAMSVGILSGQIGASLHSLASTLTEHILQRRGELSNNIDVRKVDLKASLKGYPSAAISPEVNVTKEVGVTAVVDTEVDTKSSEALLESQDETHDADAADENGVENDSPSEVLKGLHPTQDLQAAERTVAEEGIPTTTLSILEPKNDFDVVDELRGAEIALPHAEFEVLEPEDHVEASEVQDDFRIEVPGKMLAVLEPMEEVETAEDQSEAQTSPDRRARNVYIALGSNMGDRLENIENACRELDADPNIRIVKMSPLYETAPMYVEDQGAFLNGACEIETSLEPLALLDRLKAIEDRLGRLKTIDKGPRNIDLDILIYGRLSMKTDRLTIPHPLMAERHFVLQPLFNIPGAGKLKIGVNLTVSQALARIPQLAHPLSVVTPLGPSLQFLNATDPKRVTRVMSILNTTPDSFSDGGDNPVDEVERLRDTIRAQITAGATIVDVGGQSSRPNAPDVTAEEEIARILPAIEVIKSLPEAANVAISVDTYRAAVAEAAVAAGAHIINDISAGKLDPDMFATIARLGCTYVMMHMRGTPSTMMSEENCTYGDVVEDVKDELRFQLPKALNAGIRRWRIILDPGIGFSKTPAQNMELLRRLPELRTRFSTYPWLIGTSRKSFIGKITGVQEPKERVWGTSATVTAAVAGGADIVRVHDVKEMATVVRMADAMYRA